jgi:hypothetical protein
VRKYEKEAQRIFKAFDDARDALAERIRQEVILPACRKYRCEFMSGNGRWSFYMIGVERGNRGMISDEIDAKQYQKSGLIKVLAVLGMECGEKFEIGHFVRDVREKDF